MRGGKFLNNFRMAELHAKEAPDRIWELETYGALFDRTREGKISQRNFGGHEYPRLAHVGDRTGLELIRTLQQKIVSLQQEDYAETGDYEARLRVFDETTITEVFVEHGRIAGCFGYFRESATSCTSTRRRSCWPPAASASRTRSPRTRGSTPATGTRSRCAPGRR
jgi:succinate dehydrogenase / fumarate reductase flavoprotein subunit